MNNIKIKLLNPNATQEAEKMMVAMARLTQRGHIIQDLSDVEALLQKDYTTELVEAMSSLPHPTIQKFGLLNAIVVGASRRFLAQITRHQNEVKFMSGSLQYSDYSNTAQFVVPYEIISYDKESPNANLTSKYLESCAASLATYEKLVKEVGRDAAGYAMPQGLRNVLLISTTPFQWKYMIHQRVCNRNTLETQYIMLTIWEMLWDLSPMFRNCGPFCMQGSCTEGKMSCKKPFSKDLTPTEILNSRFRYLRG